MLDPWHPRKLPESIVVKRWYRKRRARKKGTQGSIYLVSPAKSHSERERDPIGAAATTDLLCRLSNAGAHKPGEKSRSTFWIKPSDTKNLVGI